MKSKPYDENAHNKWVCVFVLTCFQPTIYAHEIQERQMRPYKSAASSGMINEIMGSEAPGAWLPDRQFSWMFLLMRSESPHATIKSQ